MGAASPASPAGRTLIATARFNMESCGRHHQCPMLGLEEDHGCCIAVKTEESKASIRHSIALNFVTFGQAYLFYNSAHFFPNSSAIFSAIIIVGALVFPLGMVGMIEASTTRKFSISWTRKCSSTTAIVSFPILHVPMV